MWKFWGKTQKWVMIVIKVYDVLFHHYTNKIKRYSMVIFTYEMCMFLYYFVCHPEKAITREMRKRNSI